MPTIDIASPVYQWTPKHISAVLNRCKRYEMAASTQGSLNCSTQSADLKSRLVEAFNEVTRVVAAPAPSAAAAAAPAAVSAASSSSSGSAAPPTPPTCQLDIQLVSAYVTRHDGTKGLHVGVLVTFTGVKRPVAGYEGLSAHTTEGFPSAASTPAGGVCHCWIVDRTHAQFGLNGDAEKFPTSGTNGHRRWAAAIAKPGSEPKVVDGGSRQAAVESWKNFLSDRYRVTALAYEATGETPSSVGFL